MVLSSGFAKTDKPIRIPAKGEVEVPVSVFRAVKNNKVLLEPIRNDRNLMIARCLVKTRSSRKENTKIQKALIRNSLTPIHCKKVQEKICIIIIVYTFSHTFYSDPLYCSVKSYTSPADHNRLAECNIESIPFI